MYPAAFEYHAPSTVNEALQLLGTLDDAKILAGGHSLIPMMNALRNLMTKWFSSGPP